MRQTVFVDFDRTLFDTGRYMNVLWHALGAQYGITAEQALADVPNWYHRISEWGYYRIEDHIKDATGHTAQEAVEAVGATLKKHDFLYPDALEIFKWQKYDVRILTFGEPWFQALKLSLAPKLEQIPRDIVLQGKGAFLTAKYKNASGWLIDDKREDGLPSSIRQIWLKRTMPIPLSEENGMITVNSLKQVTQLL